MLPRHLRAASCAALLAPASALADYAVDILPPVTPVAREIYYLHWGILWVCVGIFVVVFGAMFWSIYKHRRSMGAKAAQFHENTTIEVIWTIIPFLILVGMAYPATVTVLNMKDASNSDLSIKVTAYQWKWEYEYQQDGLRFTSNLSTPRDQIEEYHGPGAKKNENYLLEVDRPMVVPVGKKVRLLITSNDVIHGWYVPQLGINQYGIPGFIKDAWFTVDTPGTYRGQCSQICGKEHAYMPIVVEAVDAARYAAWVKDVKAKMPAPVATEGIPPATKAGGAAGPGTSAASPGASIAGAVAAAAEDPNKKWTMDELNAKGQQVFAANCAACHGAEGKGTPPAFPPLAGSKVVTGNKSAQMQVVMHGKPGTAMAAFSRLSDADLAAVLTYTRNAFGNKAGDAVQPSEVKAARKG